jgi:acyl-CoA thioester hydrolase
MRGVTEERIRVRYGETDQMGHAYYANYLYWFEQARGAWCRDRGFTYKGLEEQGVLLPVVEAHVRYKGEVGYDDCVVVRVWVSEIKRAAMRFDYQVLNETTGQLTTEGYTWHVVMNPSFSSGIQTVCARQIFAIWLGLSASTSWIPIGGAGEPTEISTNFAEISACFSLRNCLRCSSVNCFHAGSPRAPPDRSISNALSY